MVFYIPKPDCCNCNTNEDCSGFDNQIRLPALDRSNYKKVMIFLLKVINWSWIEEIIFWDSCLAPFSEVSDEFIKLPFLKSIKFRRSNSREEADQEPILLLDFDKEKVPNGKIEDCCPLVVAVQMSRLISAATYRIDQAEVRSFVPQSKGPVPKTKKCTEYTDTMLFHPQE